MDDPMHPDNVELRLEGHFQRTAHHWPVLPRQRAAWWQFWHFERDHRIDAAFQIAIGRAMTDQDCKAYWRERRWGQHLFEDAGGFIWRCWSAALSIPVLDPWRLQDGIHNPPILGNDGEAN